MKRLSFAGALSALVLGLAVPASADVSATVMMRSGERVTGHLEALDGGVLFVRESKDNQRKLPFDNVALIDLVGAAKGLPETELREARGDAHLALLKDGSSHKGKLLDIEGGRGTKEGVAAKLTFVFRTESGEERRLTTDQLARLYLGNYPTQATEAKPSESTEAKSGSVRVAADQRWIDTGITVAQGQQVKFSAEGQIQLSNDEGDVALPAGSKTGRFAANAPLPTVLAGALIGRVGTGRPFGIGSQETPLAMPAAGRLFLGVNDDQLNDNKGHFTVTVVPTETTVSSPSAGARRRP